MTLKIWITLPIILIVAILVVIWLKDSNLRRSVEKIKASLYVETPEGDSFNEVLNKIKVKNLKPNVSKTAGFLKQGGGAPETIGVSSIRVHLGDYWTFPFSRVSVTAFWGFDHKGELIEIWIWKTTDSL
nr:hypothetical protein [uncultured Desulfobacter sp.]